MTKPTTSVQRKPGRPASTQHGSFSACCPKTGRALGWSDGQWAGAPELVATAKRLCEQRALLRVPTTHALVEADADDPVAAYLLLLDRRVCGPNAAVYGDVPVEALTRLADRAATEPLDLLDGVA